MSLVDLGKRLLEAAKQGDTNEVRTLMSNGAPFTTDWLGTSPLHFSAQFGHPGTAEVLLRAGISRDARTKVDRTPLHVAAQEGHLEIVELLIRNGADIEAKDMLKMTPLHWSVEKEHLEVIQTLLKRGADVNTLNKFDKNALDIASGNGRTDIVQMLQLGQTNIVEVTTEPEEVIQEVEEGLEIVTDNTSPLVIAAEPIHIKPEPVTVISDLLPRKFKRAAGKGADGGGDQSSTAVLATLAALAEASGPLTSVASTTAAEALSWLEQHGITMISSSDSSTIVTSTLENGQNLALTEAGKLALNQLVKQGGVSDEQEEDVTVTEDVTVDGVVDDDESQNIITIVTEGDYEQNVDEEQMIVGVPVSEEVIEEPPAKRLRIDLVEDEEFEEVTIAADDHDLRRQLEKVQREAEIYKLQLRAKEQEAEVYKKQLTEITVKGSPS